MQEIIEKVEMEDFIRSDYTIVGFNPLKKEFKTILLGKNELGKLGKIDLQGGEWVVEGYIESKSWRIEGKGRGKDILRWKDRIKKKYNATTIGEPKMIRDVDIR